MTYAEKLKDPRWQKKRLQVLERDNWECKHCLCKDKPLHVHHKFYERDADPWESDIDTLLTLCEECHEIEELVISKKKLLVSNLTTNGVNLLKCCPACGNRDIKNYHCYKYHCDICGFRVYIYHDDDYEAYSPFFIKNGKD